MVICKIIRMPIVIIMVIIRMMTVDTPTEIADIITRESISLATKIASAAARRASAAATMANAGIITTKVSVGMGIAIMIDI